MKNNFQDLLTDIEFRKFVLNPRQGDSKYWDVWKNESQENQQLFEETEKLIKDFYEPLSAEEFQTEAIEFKRKIDVTNAEKNDIISLYENRKSKRNSWITRIAASIIIAIVSVFTISYLINYSQENTISSIDPTLNMIQKEAGRGQKLTIMLPDGSKVKLNSESYIIFPEEFRKDVREVTVSGEAFFDITHNKNWPFVVESKNVWTKVLGTSFNVLSYPDENFVDIALVEGIVEVTTLDKASVQLSSSEMARIDKEHTEIIVSEVDIEKVTAWKENRLIFENASFDEIQCRLERWYNVEFVYDKRPVFEGGYTVDVTDERLELVLKGMSENKFKFRFEGKKVIIY